MTLRALPVPLSFPRPGERSLTMLALPAAVIVGWAVVERQTLVGLAAATLLCLPLLVSPRFRVIWVVFGALAFFGTTAELTAGKLAYLYGIGFAITGSVAHAHSLRHTRAFALLTPLIWASGAFAVLAAASLVVSVLNGTPQTDWLRDLAPYVLFAAAPFLALDAQHALSTRALEGVLGLAGLVAAVSFGVKWATSRGIADLSALPAGFPSTLLAAALGTYATSKLLTASGRRGVWLLLAAATFSLLLVTGTRTTLILLVAPLAIVFGSLRGFSARALRFAVAIPLLALVVGLSLQSIVRVSGGDTEMLQRRVSLLRSSGAAVDQSYRDRLTQSAVATDVFRENPVLGAGPGVEFVWYDTFGERFSVPNLDTPISFVSKFGVLGLVWLLIVVLAYLRLYLALRRRGGEPTAVQLALLGYAVVVAGYSVLQVSFEDKGLAPAILLLVALATREHVSQRSTDVTLAP